MRIVLASASPRRTELLGALIDDFDVIPADIAEDLGPDARADALRLATEKARAVAAEPLGALGIGSDTIVHDDERSYGKPADATDASAMLSRLRGRRHLVTTGVAVLFDGQVDAAFSEAEVHLACMSDAAIAAYVASGRPLDKAGSYAIQDADVPTVQHIDGCSCSVVGLPLWRLKRMLEARGVQCREPSKTLARCADCPERDSARARR
jgi:septum formation protein